MSLELSTVDLGELGTAGSYLVLDGGRSGGCDLGDLAASGATHVCWVTYGDAVAAARRRPTDADYERVMMLAVGDLATSGGGDRHAGVRSVVDPLDVRSVGLAVHEFCTDHADESVAVVVDTLSTLVAYVGPRVAFQFVYLLLERVAAADGHAFVLFDPAAHDDHVVAGLSSPFDAVVDPAGVCGPVDLPEATDDDVAALVDDWTVDVAAGRDPSAWDDAERFPDASTVRDALDDQPHGEPTGTEDGRDADVTARDDATTTEASDADIAETLRDV